MDRLGDRSERTGPASAVPVDEVEAEGEGEERDQGVCEEGGEQPEDLREEVGDHRQQARDVHAREHADADRREVLVELVVAQRVAPIEAARR